MRRTALLLAFAASALGGCASSSDSTDATPDGGTPASDGGASGPDGGSDGGPTGPSGSVDTGRNLPGVPCAGRDGDASSRLILHGTVLTPDDVIRGAYVSIDRTSGRIDCVGTDCADRPQAQGVKVVCTDRLLAPGLVNSHDHAQYNHAPRLQFGRKFQNRYAWQGTDLYRAFNDAYDATKPKKCEVHKWASTRLILGGTTSVAGTSVTECGAGLVRELDGSETLSALDGYKMTMQSGRIGRLRESDADGLRNKLAQRALDAWTVHVGEGVDMASRDEWKALQEKMLAVPNVAVIHAVSLGAPEWNEAAASGVSLIWSPRSNVDLYGETTRVTVARKLGVNIALSTDWSPSGSMNLLEELRCARVLSTRYYDDAFSPRELVRMVTTNAAKAVGADGLLGELVAGAAADVAVFEIPAGQDRATFDPWNALIVSKPRDVALVLVHGRALYGEPALLMSAAPPEGCDTLDVCGQQKAVCLRGPGLTGNNPPGSTQSLDDVKQTLETVLNAARANAPSAVRHLYDLMPLFECQEASPDDVCTLEGPRASGQPDADDPDGDDRVGTADNCPQVFNVDQDDADGDGSGDACDVCPLVRDLSDCTPATGQDGDADGDNIADEQDNCPNAANLDQADDDQDGHGNVCDACPQAANPGSAGCTLTIADLRDPTRRALPAAGSPVTIAGATVLAVRKDPMNRANAFWVGGPFDAPYGGLYIFAAGKSVGDVDAGDLVTVTGKYTEYFDLTELTAPTWTVTASGSAPGPIVVASACDVGTGGTLAEPYESLLVEVRNVAVTNENPDGPDEDFGEIEVEGCLRIDSMIWTDRPRPAVGTRLSRVAGVLYYAFGNTKLLPRGPQDWEVVP